MTVYCKNRREAEEILQSSLFDQSQILSIERMLNESRTVDVCMKIFVIESQSEILITTRLDQAEKWLKSRLKFLEEEERYEECSRIFPLLKRVQSETTKLKLVPDRNQYRNETSNSW